MIYVDSLPVELREEARYCLRQFDGDRFRVVRFWTASTVKLAGVYEAHELVTIARTIERLIELEALPKR